MDELHVGVEDLDVLAADAALVLDVVHRPAYHT